MSLNYGLSSDSEIDSLPATSFSNIDNKKRQRMKKAGKSDKDKDIGLESYEKAVYLGEYTKALNMLTRLLNKEQHFDVLPLENESQDEYKVRVQLSIDRFVSATTALFASNQWTLAQRNFDILMQFKNQLIKLYTTSSFGGTDHIFSILSPINYETDEDKIFRFQLFICLESHPELIKLVMSQPYICLTTVVWMATELSLVWSDKEEYRELLFELLLARSKTEEAPKYVLKHFARPYMHCSYIVNDKRHIVKMALNNMVKNKFKTDFLSYNLSSKKSKTDKPILLVPIEKFNHNHAMFRCYKGLVSRLKQQFFVIFAAKKGAIDEYSKHFYDKLVIVNDDIDLDCYYEKLAKKFARLKPDMVFYPSVGMDSWTAVLSNFRLAPVQCFALGHPATTCSEHMDFAISDCFNDTECFTEKLIEPKNNLVPFVKPKFEIQVERKTTPNRVDIAVVSSFMKINGVFIELCKEIAKHSEKEVVFHFYPMASGIFYHYISKMVMTQVPNALVYKTLPYNAFINSLSRCQLRLGTFPFGGTNTNIDCFALGIPFVTMEGPEAFSHQDTVFYERIDFDEQLVASDLDDYLSKTMELIHNDSLRDEISKKMTRVFDSNVLFEGENDEERGITANSLKWILENADKMKKSETRLFKEGGSV